MIEVLVCACSELCQPLRCIVLGAVVNVGNNILLE